jgi:hypothetical protein
MPATTSSAVEIPNSSPPTFRRDGSGVTALGNTYDERGAGRLRAAPFAGVAGAAARFFRAFTLR